MKPSWIDYSLIMAIEVTKLIAIIYIINLVSSFSEISCLYEMFFKVDPLQFFQV